MIYLKGEENIALMNVLINISFTGLPLFGGGMLEGWL